MYKTLLYLTAVRLIPEDSVLLMDEFENSLGVNCIDIFQPSQIAHSNLQFILTSHHPYIINNIPIANWKIVSRSRGKVVVKNASDYGLEHSKHEAFKRLLNLSAYQKGFDEE